MSESEPRRSVRSTKGQHKALDQLEQPIEPKRRGRKSKKAAQDDKHEEDDAQDGADIIRCVCGTTEQVDGDERAWIACDQCGVWQHNVCVGISVYKEDIPDKYYCEQCRPEDHKELLDGIARGEKPWEAREKAHEEEQAHKKKRGPKKGKKRQSDQPEEPTSSQKSKASPAPDKKEVPPKTAGAGIKRKTREEQPDKDANASQKLRKVSDGQASPVPAPSQPRYSPPADLPDKISQLPGTRQGSAKLLAKSLTHAIDAVEKKGTYSPADGVSNESRAERLAIAIERAVHDTHATHKDYSAQIRTLSFNLKSNLELCTRLLGHTLIPPTLAIMKTEELASKELRKETAEMKARAEKQSILITEDGPPRLRRTHKGDEVVADDTYAAPSEEVPSVTRRLSAREQQVREQEQESAPPAQQEEEHNDGDTVELPADLDRHSPVGEPMQIDTQNALKSEFDINKVFDSVKSPTEGAVRPRQPSIPAPLNGPGVDPDVDRLLEDDEPESPPYSPTENTGSPYVWRGNVVMNSLANFQGLAEHVAGADLSKSHSIPWSAVLPDRLTVSGRITEQSANVYLCSLRYAASRSIIVMRLDPATVADKDDWVQLFSYFVQKQRYGVVGDKGVGNVRDMYLVPVLRGGSTNIPEFLLNFEDNSIPDTRDENMLLLVAVYSHDGPVWGYLGDTSPIQASATKGVASPTSGGPVQQNLSASAMSPTPGPQSTIPVSAASQSSQMAYASPQPLHHAGEQATPQGAGPPSGTSTALPAQQEDRDAKQKVGMAMGREILGPFMNEPVVSFFVPQAWQMKRQEWELMRHILQHDERARHDLRYLSTVLEMRGGTDQQQVAATQGQLPPAAANAGNTTQQRQPAALQQGPSAVPMAVDPAKNHTPPASHPPGAAHQSRQHYSPLPNHPISRTPIPIPVPPGMPASVAQAHQAMVAQQQYQPHQQQQQQPR
ncbi:Transcription factor BYE1 [Pleurostoma richardsiae]|uniref:Transcription factor BYE1 n=1 Tax=Pleurostoma richardsiae TaxID=41990 RepID=A0AA38RZX3_9PEZI|nr:Transcription factor BYE1 [Pleurostoma richardsiae]